MEEKKVRFVFHNCLKKMGLTKQKNVRGPRIMDLRHTFAVKTILRWYKKNVPSIDSHLPVLSTYLGHVRPSNTYWYLSISPELLNFVLARCKKINRRVKYGK